ncbi:MAG: Flp pilus assembly protein CpaB [Xanthobacteraceae bacterium]|nr:Flp pilus assembly protein CpaB [Xanthobacteraceae bacterium]MCW5679022.1 Flp pilus assembly protein CpaB [Xanthobacteraceae bacterium]
MRISAVLMIVVALVFGALAVFVAQSWLNSQNDARLKNVPAPVAVKTRKIVVATAPLRFGVELNAGNLREVPWPENAVPDGSFASIEALLAAGKRMVLTAIAENEPVLAAKITGPGQRATLSAVLTPGMKAVTVRVNDIEGVAGFVLPGDRVDILLTRNTSSERGVNANSSSDVVLQNVRVLAIDQIADDRIDKPAVVKAVTLEVEMSDGQKLALAASLGTLTLALRKAGDLAAQPSRQITSEDLGKSQKKNGPNGNYSTITVTRGTKKENYSVPAEATQKTLTNSAINQEATR